MKRLSAVKPECYKELYGQKKNAAIQETCEVFFKRKEDDPPANVNAKADNVHVSLSNSTIPYRNSASLNMQASQPSCVTVSRFFTLLKVTRDYTTNFFFFFTKNCLRNATPSSNTELLCIDIMLHCLK